jgi:hypothetical protein
MSMRRKGNPKWRVECASRVRLAARKPKRAGLRLREREESGLIEQNLGTLFGHVLIYSKYYASALDLANKKLSYH